MDVDHVWLVGLGLWARAETESETRRSSEAAGEFLLIFSAPATPHMTTANLRIAKNMPYIPPILDLAEMRAIPIYMPILRELQLAGDPDRPKPRPQYVCP